MSADCQENACNSEKGEHLLARFWTCIPPSVHAGIQAFGEVVMLCDVEPRCFFSGDIFNVVCISWHSLTYAPWVALVRNGHDMRSQVRQQGSHLPNFVFEQIDVFRVYPTR